MPITIPPGFDKTLALKLANATALAYTQFQDPSQFLAPPGYTIRSQFWASVFGSNEVFGYLMSSTMDAILAFRGTAGFPDAIADIRFNQVPCPFDASAGATHAGFTGVYQSIRDAVVAAIATLPAGLPFYVTGHSLGGAVATLATLDVAVNTRFSSPIVYTIASPRVGDPDFANRFDSVVGTNHTTSWRVVNMFDLVPLLPPEEIFDPLAGKTYHFQHVDEVLRIAFFKGGAAANHDLQNYIQAINQLA